MSESSKHSSHEAKPGAADQGELFGVLAEFQSPGALISAAKKVRDAGFTKFDCYSPFPVHGIDEAMGIKRTILPLLVFGGGMTGLCLGLLLQWWTNAHDWPWIVSGKPFFSIPANVPVAFEATILLSVLTTFFGMWILNKLPQVWHPFFRMDSFARATNDNFFIGIEAGDEKFSLEATMALLRDAGALSVEPCHKDPDPAAAKMPKWVYGLVASTTALALVPFAIVAKARASQSREPHYHIFSDMDFQPKAKSDSLFPLFGDMRANRGAIAGTMARGGLRTDDAYYRGLEMATDANGVTTASWITGLPAQVQPSDKLMARGKQTFGIYCAPCHGYDGRGRGAVPERVARGGGAWAARNLVEAPMVKLPNGQLYNTISNGYNTMMGYKEQIPVADRWAVVLYVRALQRSANATQGDVPADQLSQLP